MDKSAVAAPFPAWRTAPAKQHASVRVRRDIVVIGSAAGGLAAICKLLSGLPPSFDAAVLIALDIDSQPASIVLQILRGYSQLPVHYATDCALVRRGRVVVAPAHRHLRIAQPGLLALEEASPFAACGRSANGLFKSAAAAYGERVVGIVLSGVAPDGPAGLSFIEAAGGVGIVLDPDGASDESRSSGAMHGDPSDYCSVLDKMAALLVALAAVGTPPTRFFSRKNG